MFTFLIAWSSDIAAFLVGKLVGGPKLWRRYSPNKTWSGFAGGMIAGMMAAGTLSDMTHLFKHDTSASFVGLLTALSTMAGDLWESALNRAAPRSVDMPAVPQFTVLVRHHVIRIGVPSAAAAIR